MRWYKDTITVQTRGKGLYPITDAVVRIIRRWDIQDGMAFLYIQHTSASLLISESYDPSARADLETYMERLAPEDQPWMRHKLEGPDDSSSHLRAMLTPVNLTIPLENGALLLGTWQGIFLFEHRAHSQQRNILLRCISMETGAES